MRAFLTFSIFIAALMGEQYIYEVTPMKQKLLAVLPAAIEDQKTIVERLKGRAKTVADMAKEAAAQCEADPDNVQFHANRSTQAEIEHWQSLRVLMLLELMQKDREESENYYRSQGITAGVV